LSDAIVVAAHPDFDYVTEKYKSPDNLKFFPALRQVNKKLMITKRVTDWLKHQDVDSPRY
jgi:hypothetical protein